MRAPIAATLLFGCLCASACSKEATICRRMNALCGTEQTECAQRVDAMKKAAGEDAVSELASCYAEADSCAEATGCEAALTIKGAASAMREFLDGFGKEIETPDDEP